jgi:hypothetical protein
MDVLETVGAYLIELPGVAAALIAASRLSRSSELKPKFKS